MSKPTKEQLSAGLEELILEKPLSKITVGEVARQSGLSRMTFYYHFKSIDDLVKWTFEKRISETLQRNEDAPGWRRGLHVLFAVMLENSTLVSSVYHSVAHDQLYGIASELLRSNVHDDFDRVTRDMRMSMHDRAFVASFYVNAIIGICFDWIAAGMDEKTVDSTIERCCLALQASVMNVLDAFDKDSSARSN